MEPRGVHQPKIGIFSASFDVIGIERDEAWQIVTKAAFDSVPALRLDVLRALFGNGWLTTTQIEAAVAYPNTTTRRTLEDLHAHGLVARELGGQGKPHRWQITEEPARQLVKIQRLTLPEMSGGSPKGASESEESAFITTNTVVETTFRERSHGAPAPSQRNGEGLPEVDSTSGETLAQMHVLGLTPIEDEA